MENPFPKALELLDEKGWSSSGPEGPRGEQCILFALERALRLSLNLPTEERTRYWGLINQTLSRVITEHELGAHHLRYIGRQHLVNIGDWNDHSNTSEEDVRLALKLSTVLWEERHESIS